MKFYKFIFIGIISLAIFLSVEFLIAKAESENEGDDNYRSAPSSNISTPASSTKKVASSGTITKTIIVQPAKTITSTVMENVQIPDSDKDGLPDETDPYPNIAQQLIVSDSNLDGIDDKYELQIAK